MNPNPQSSQVHSFLQFFFNQNDRVVSFQWRMPSVPPSKENGTSSPVCPFTGKMGTSGNKNGAEKGEKGREVQGVNGENGAGERKWIRPDLSSKCTWKLGAPHTDSPHTHPPRWVPNKKMLVYSICYRLKKTGDLKQRENMGTTIQNPGFVWGGGGN